MAMYTVLTVFEMPVQESTGKTNRYIKQKTDEALFGVCSHTITIKMIYLFEKQE
jgi:hypothetical protein